LFRINQTKKGGGCPERKIFEDRILSEGVKVLVLKTGFNFIRVG
jgi:hypothetical protein